MVSKVKIMLGAITLTAAFNASACAQIVNLAKRSGMSQAGLVQGQSDKTIRTAQVAWLDDQGDAAWVMQRIVALVVGSGLEGVDLSGFVAERLSIHKRPREVRVVDALPRNEMGKVLKAKLLG